MREPESFPESPSPLWASVSLSVTRWLNYKLKARGSDPADRGGLFDDDHEKDFSFHSGHFTEARH